MVLLRHLLPLVGASLSVASAPNRPANAPRHRPARSAREISERSVSGLPNPRGIPALTPRGAPERRERRERSRPSPKEEKEHGPLPDATVIQGGYIVEFDEGHTFENLRSVLDNAGLNVKPRRKLSYKLFNGASFTVDSDDSPAAVLAHINSIPGVKAAWPLHKVRRGDDRLISKGFEGGKFGSIVRRQEEGDGDGEGDGEDDAAGFEPHLLTQVNLLHEAGYTGKGARVGIVDDGIDYLHPDLGGCFGEGCLVTHGANFLLEDDEWSGLPPRPADDPWHLCSDGHGTHVAGTVAAQKNDMGFIGAAPDATLGMYRVFDCSGWSEEDIMIAGMNQAYEDGNDIISMSFGTYAGWSQSPWSLSAERIAQEGVPLVISAGNAGGAGLWVTADPASAKSAISVGSTDVTAYPQMWIVGEAEVDGGESTDFLWQYSWSPFDDVSLPLRSLEEVLANVTHNGTIPTGCYPLPDDTPDLSSQALLVKAEEDWSICDELDQSYNLQEKGAEYLIFYWEDLEYTFPPWVADEIKGNGQVKASQAQTWLDTLDSGSNITVHFDPVSEARRQIEYVEDETSGLASYFTSWGPSWDLSQNPSFSAPGGYILSTMPTDLGSYGVMSGTSMSAPLVAGTLALVAEARGTFDAGVLRAVLATTANPLVYEDLWEGGVDPEGRLAPVPQVGGGLIQAFDAANVKGVLSTNALELNDTANADDEVIFRITNTGSESATYELGHTPALTLYSFEEGESQFMADTPPIADGAYADVLFDSSSVTVGAGETVEITLAIAAPAGLDSSRIPVYSGWVTLNGTNGDALSLPYMGVAASLKDETEVFQPGMAEFLDWYNYDFIQPDQVIVLPPPGTDPYSEEGWDSDYLVADLYFTTGTTIARAELIALSGRNGFCVTDGALLGDIFGFPQEYRGRLGAGAIFDGQLANGTYVSAGRYRLKISALNLFGDIDVKEDWSIDYSPPFFIEYEEEQ